MFDPNIINDMTKKISENLPENLKILQEDFTINLKSAIQHALDKLDVITREEFDVQTKVLAKTRAKLEALSLKVKHLEDTLHPTKEKETIA